MSRFTTCIFALAMGASLAGVVSAQCAPRSDAPRGVWDTTNATIPNTIRPTADGIGLVRGIACRPDLAFDDGIVEFELAPPANGFAGIAFRMASSADYEIVYFRSSAEGRWLGAQYQPVYEGETTWQLYHGDGYEADIPARVATTPDGWLRIRLVIAGQRADLYVGNDSVPLMRVRELKRARARGPIAIWAAGQEATGVTANVRSLRVRPLGGAVLASVPPETASPGQLMRWRVSPRFPARDSTSFADTLSSEARRAVTGGRVAVAEASGLVNLTATIGNPAGPQRTNVFGGAGWGVAYATVTMRSERAQTRRLSLSYSETIGVYVNGALIYVGDNTYGVRTKDNLGVVGHEGETLMLPLRPGDNDIVLAIADKAFGWGFRARLDSLDDVRIAP
ncbi:MAG: hypothetical protein ACM3SX_05850 [Deltaproteobacteria bacterium]